MTITPRSYGHRNRSFTMQLDHPPQAVFPLLCPVREYDWIAHWQCELVHSVSGVAEKGCVFITDFPGTGPATWNCTRYEPSRAIEYTVLVHAGFFRCLSLNLAPVNTGCILRWDHSYTAISVDGARAMDREDDAVYEQQMHMLESSLAHYLATGRCLGRDT